MRATVQLDQLTIDKALYEFVNNEVLPGTAIGAREFWSGFTGLVRSMAPRNAALLERRDELQSKIDCWHRQYPGPRFDRAKHRAYLSEIGYLAAEREPFAVITENVDEEIARIAGPQLVVPVSNARYALNAANARWGSLYDALYGTDVIPEEAGAPRGGEYNAQRGTKVIAFVRAFLDKHFALAQGSHRDAVHYHLIDKALYVELNSGESTQFKEAAAFAGFQGDSSSPRVLLLVHNGLHVELHIDRAHHIGRTDPAGISDVVLESAITTIQDLEDSVAAVDADDKINVYRNWLGLMKGDLQAQLQKGPHSIARRLNADRQYKSLQGEDFVLSGRSLMLVRNVGHHMFTDIVTLDGAPIPETFIDAAVTVLIAVHDLRGARARHNSRTGSVYVVKPKMHGAEEVAFAVELFSAVEKLLALPPNTVKIGIMDEERRTTLNLMECIRAARERVAFINTGFLDRTGDEIHTSMEAGVIPRKSELKKAVWLNAYERRNVDIGLACGLPGHAQIGKGMWAMPDLMADMLNTKIAHPRAGANTAWVPSPTAATLHALHYHEVNVAEVQAQLAKRPRASLDEILTPTLVTPQWSQSDIQEELNSNAQSILGYVVRWIDSGIGCSKVPDYHNVALMEDRATLRISSQHVANWLLHGICSETQAMTALRRMAVIVDQQNAGDPNYRRLSDDPESNVAFKAACDLIFKGREQPNGYTERILTARRLERKAQI